MSEKPPDRIRFYELGPSFTEYLKIKDNMKIFHVYMTGPSFTDYLKIKDEMEPLGVVQTGIYTDPERETGSAFFEFEVPKWIKPSDFEKYPLVTEVKVVDKPFKIPPRRSLSDTCL